MSSVFRKSAMERLASPDRLDCMLKVTSPRSWVILVTSVILVVVVVVWSFLGKIPSTLSTIGFIVNNYSTNTLYSSLSGEVLEINVSVGSEIKKGDKILTVSDVSGESKAVEATQSGIVSKVLVEKGGEVTPNMEIFRISPITENDLTLVCYVGLDAARQLEEGNEVKVYPSSVDSDKYGNMLAKITNIDSYITTGNAISEILGADGQMANVLTSNGPVVAVTCELEPNKENKSGYYFSTDKAGDVLISSGEQAGVQIVLSEKSPISKVFPKLGGD